MSKGGSGLFRGTIGAKASAISLKSKVRETVNKLIDKTPGGKSKAMAVGGYDKRSGKVVASFAGEIPKEIHPELQKRAEAIGGIGSHGLTERNTVGVCAEFHVVNRLLLNGSKWSDIRLSTPIRPRTGAEMPFCANCRKMFSDLIDE